MWSICMRFQYVINCLYDIHTFRISRLSSFVLLFILVFRYFLDFFFFLINSWENCSFVNFSFFSDVLNVLFFFLYNSTPTLLHKFTTDERGKQPPNVSRSFSVKQEKKKMSFLVNGWIFILFFCCSRILLKMFVCVCLCSLIEWFLKRATTNENEAEKTAKSRKTENLWIISNLRTRTANDNVDSIAISVQIKL